MKKNQKKIEKKQEECEEKAKKNNDKCKEKAEKAKNAETDSNSLASSILAGTSVLVTTVALLF
jgi:F0F1-type ATP synthase assembly protein I